MVATLAQAEQKIKNMEPFRLRDVLSGSLPPVALEPGAFGALPEGYWGAVMRARYVVWSYWTPIAWVNQDGTKTVPDVGYSATTGQHQMAVMSAWDLPVRYPARGRDLRPAGGGPRRGGIDDL